MILGGRCVCVCVGGGGVQSVRVWVLYFKTHGTNTKAQVIRISRAIPHVILNSKESQIAFCSSFRKVVYFLFLVYIYIYIHTYIHRDVSVAEWLLWLTSNCVRIGAIGSSPSNGLWGQKGFNPLCQCVYVYVCIVNPDIQTKHRCSHTSIHTYTHIYIHTQIEKFNFTMCVGWVKPCV